MKNNRFVFLLTVFLLSCVTVFAAVDVQFVGNIKQSLDPVGVGSEVVFSASFKPAGGAVANLKIIGGVDGVKIFERVYASILADKVKIDSFKWTATAGTHTVWFQLDPDHTSGDSNYANNKLEKAVNVGNGPDTNVYVKSGKRGNIFYNSTDIYVVKMWLTTYDGEQAKLDKPFSLNCQFHRSGPQPPGKFHVEMWADTLKLVCSDSSCAGNPTDTDKSAMANPVALTCTNCQGKNVTFKCALIWDDPSYNEVSKVNNTMDLPVYMPK